MKCRRFERGSALLTVVALSAVLLAVVIGVLTYASNVRRRTINSGRAMTEQSCVAAGLEIARARFGANYIHWNEYLSTPSVYNPIGWSVPDSTSSSATSSPTTSLFFVKSPPGVDSQVEDFRHANPGLFADLDNDGKPDVYIYCRDNMDERPPAPNNWNVDSDQTIIVGAMCISDTLAPRRPDGTIDPDMMTAEALLKWDYRSAGNNDLSAKGAPGHELSIGGAGGDGSGNRNN